VLRLAAFFVLAVALSAVLGHLPLVGPLFRHTGILGVLLSAALLSAVFTRLGERLLSGRKLRAELRSLAAVASAHNQGKIGTLTLARGRPRAALAPLEAATRGEPEVAEWHYRLGLARLAVKDLSAALVSLEACIALEEEHAYGSAVMRRAETLARLGRPGAALEALALFEQNHGPSPEAAFRRGRALDALGRRDEARAAYREVGALARTAARYHQRSAGVWALRALLARIV
jgi:tetratricopeptide (TPR) repeat protein